MAEEDSNPQWKKLQEMRKAKGEFVTPEPTSDSSPPPVDAKAESPRNADGTFAKAPPSAESVPPAEPAAPPIAAAPIEPAAPAGNLPQSVEIDIDGQKVSVDPLIAEAFQKAEKMKAASAKDAERAALRAEIIEEVKASLPASPPPKSEAELAAERAIAEAARLKMPDDKLMISDPAEYQAQMKLYIEQQVNAAKESTKAEIRAETQKDQQKFRATEEQRARDVLAEQFYNAYPIFRGKESLVNSILKDQFDAVIASGRLNKPLTAKEAEALKSEQFADAATKATRELVQLMRGAKTVVPPTPPPAVVSSAPVKAPAPPSAEPTKSREPKYPKGSVSALLAERKARLEGATA